MLLAGRLVPAYLGAVRAHPFHHHLRNPRGRPRPHAGALKRDKNGDMPVVIDGWRNGDTIKVEGISARGSGISVH
jgi:hypothetical protein